MRKTILGFCALVALTACGGAQAPAEGHDPELVVMAGALDNRFVAAGQPADIVSRLRIDTRALPGAARPPINLALVVDTSGSMEGDAIADARRASLTLVDMLRPRDRLAVVSFNSDTEVLLPSTHLEGADTNELRRKIGRMEARGTTDLSGGLQAGLEELVRNYEPEGINRLVLLSDGVPNDPANILAFAQAAGERGIRITALGLGLDYDETLLGQVAQASGGRFEYVEESSRVAEVFRDEVLRFERVLARNMRLELRPGPGVRIDGVVGQPVALGNGRVQVSLGDLSEGEQREVFVRLHADPRRVGATVELMDAVLFFDDAVAEAGALERRVFLGAHATDQAAEIESGHNVEVERAAARMLAAVTTVQAIEQARLGDVAQARQLLDRAAAEARSYAGEGDAALTAQVAEMQALSEALPSVAPAGGAPAAPPPPAASDDEGYRGPPAAVVRQAHERAMSVIQSE